MSDDRGIRILAGALQEGSLAWEELRAAMAEAGPEASPADLLSSLILSGVLGEAELRLFESTRHEGDTVLDPQGVDLTPLPPPRRPTVDPVHAPHGEAAKVLTSFSVPSWKQYRNLRFVGEGGMGRIFKAFDGSLRRMVALKFLRRTEPELVARFLLEAQHQAMVDHPNLCKVFEAGEWQGMAYIAMQFIRGESLDRASEGMTLAHKAEVMEAVSEAVHAAHRQGLIHRDLKPANIMVESVEGRCPKPYVLDFGLARGVEQTGYTVEGLVVGTFHFMAPEQARGEVQSLTRRTDVYALGATLYALIAGKPPFWDVEGLECVRRTIHEEPVPLRELVPDLPEDLDTIVMKCLEKDPAQRYDSARALAEDLRRYRENEPLLARRPTLAYRARKFALRHKAIVAVTGAALAAVLAFGAFGIHAWATARSRARYAQQYGQEAEHLEALARYLRLMPAHDIRSGLETLRIRLRDLGEQVRKEGRDAAGPGAYALGRGALALGDPEAALRHFQEAVARGYQDPLVRQALGRVQGALYQRALQRAHQISDPDLRTAALRRAERDWRDPARANLGAGVRTGLDRALLAFYEGREAEALDRARACFREEPWRYEAKALEGEILQAQALRAPRPAETLAGLEGAVAAYREAQRVAPSDPALLIGEARAWRDLVRYGAKAGADGTAAEEACRQAAEGARRLHGDLPEPDALQAAVHAALFVQKARLGQPEAAEIEAALAHARSAVALDPRHREARSALVEALWRRGQLREREAAGRQDLGEALALVDQGLVEDPADAFLQAMAAGICTRRMLGDIREGRAPWGEFERGMTYLLKGMALDPLRPSLFDGAVTLWLERAEYERQQGLDPLESCRQGEAACARLVSLRPGDARVEEQRAVLCLIRGEYRLDRGQDPTGDLEGVLVGYGDLLKVGGGGRAPHFEAAAAHLGRARWALLTGGDPRSHLEGAKAPMARMKSIRPEATLLLEAKAALLEARLGLRGATGRLEASLRRLMAGPYGGLRESRLLEGEAALLGSDRGRMGRALEGLEGLARDPFVAALGVALARRVGPGTEKARAWEARAGALDPRWRAHLGA